MGVSGIGKKILVFAAGDDGIVKVEPKRLQEHWNYSKESKT
jgi:hypothetical protein